MASIDPSSLKVVDLRAELGKRNLSTKGKKDELIERLTEALESQTNEESDEPLIEQPKEQVTVEVLIEKQEVLEDLEEKPVEKPEETPIESPKEEKVNTKHVEQTPESTAEKSNNVAVVEKADQAKEEITAPSQEKPKEIKAVTPKPEIMDTERNAKRRLSSENDRTEGKIINYLYLFYLFFLLINFTCNRKESQD